MSKPNDIQDSILKAIDTIAQRRIDQLKLDKTITAVINSAVGVVNGRKVYKVEYEGGYFNATAQNENDAYLPRMAVYVQIPEGNFSNEKFILGKASKLATDAQISVVSAIANNYGITGKNVIDNKTKIMGVRSYHDSSEGPNSINHKFNFLYQESSEDETNQIKVDSVALNLYKKNATAIMVRADFMTRLTDEQKRQAGGEYGLVFNLVFNNLAAGHGETQGAIFDYYDKIVSVTREDGKLLKLSTCDEAITEALGEESDKDYTEIVQQDGLIDEQLSWLQEIDRVYKNENSAKYTNELKDLIEKYSIMLQDMKRLKVSEDTEENKGLWKKELLEHRQKWMDEIVGQPAEKIVSYYLSSNDMIGNPFSFSSWISQYAVFEVDLENFVKVDSILLYQQGFKANAVVESLREEDILVKNIQLYAMRPLTDDAAGYQLKVEDKDNGMIFDGRDQEAKLTVQATLFREYYEDLSRNSKTTFYWFKQSEAIVSPVQNDYSIYGGIGWKELKGQNNFKLEISIKDNLAYENHYRCAVVYMGEETPIVLRYDFIIYNYAGEKFLLQSNLGTDFTFDAGAPILTIYYQPDKEKDEWIELEKGKKDDERHYICKWAIIDGNNQKTFLDEKNEIDLTNITTSNYLNYSTNTKLLKDIKWYRHDDEITKNKEFATRIQYPMSNVATAANITFECYINYRKDENSQSYLLGKAMITLNNFEVLNANSYRVWIENGDQVFQYDEYGNSPAEAKYKDPQEILPIKAHLYSPNNIEIQDSSFKVRWYFPVEESLIEYDSVNAEIDPTTGIANLFKTNEVDFNIKKLYDRDALDNQIECQIDFNDNILYSETTFNFTKVGNNGTNGTDIVAKIVPKETKHIYLTQPLCLYVEKQSNRVSINSSNLNLMENSLDLNNYLDVKLYQKSQEIDNQNYSIKWNIAGNTSSANNKYGKNISIEENRLIWYNNLQDKDISFNGKIDINENLLLEDAPEKLDDLEDKDIKYPILTEYKDRNEYFNDLNNHKKKVKLYQNELNIYIDNWKQKQNSFKEILKNLEDEEEKNNIEVLIENIEIFIESLITQYNQNEKYIEWLLEILETSKKYTQYILKSESVFDKKSYYAFYNLPVIFYEDTIPTQEAARIGIDRDTLIKEVIYNADGRDPEYNHNQGLKLLNIPDNCVVSWEACGGYNTAEDRPNFKLLLNKEDKKEYGINYEYTENQNQIFILPDDSFSGAITNNYIKAKIYKYEILEEENEESVEEEFVEEESTEVTEDIEKENSYEKRAALIQEMNQQKNIFSDQSHQLIERLKESRENNEIDVRDIFQKISELEHNLNIATENCYNQWSLIINDEYSYEQTSSLKIVRNLFNTTWILQLLTNADSILKQYIVKNRDYILENIEMYRIEKEYLKKLIVNDSYFDLYYFSTEKELQDAKKQWNSIFNLAMEEIENEFLPELFIIDTSTIEDEEEKARIDEYNSKYIMRVEEIQNEKEEELLREADLNKEIVNNLTTEIQNYSKQQKNEDKVAYELIATVIVPVNMSLNTYGLASLNAWDGNSIAINDDERYIMAPQIGAGYKEIEDGNLFTGVVMGQVNNYSDNPTHQYTGLMGFKQGVRSFFLDAENGNAFFGTPKIEEAGADGMVEKAIWNEEKQKYIVERIPDYNEGLIELKPGEESVIGGWRLGRRSLYYITDDDGKTKDIDKAYTDDWAKKAEHQKDIGNEDKGILLNAAPLPYLSIKGKPLTVGKGSECDIDNTSGNAALANGDSLELNLDPNQKDFFTMFRHHKEENEKWSRYPLVGIDALGRFYTNALKDKETSLNMNYVAGFGKESVTGKYVGLNIGYGTGTIIKNFIEAKENAPSDDPLYISGGILENEYVRPISIHGKQIKLYASSGNNINTETNTYITISDGSLKGRTLNGSGFNFFDDEDIESNINSNGDLKISSINYTLNTNQQDIKAEGNITIDQKRYNDNEPSNSDYTFNLSGGKSFTLTGEKGTITTDKDNAKTENAININNGDNSELSIYRKSDNYIKLHSDGLDINALQTTAGNNTTLSLNSKDKIILQSRGFSRKNAISNQALSFEVLNGQNVSTWFGISDALPTGEGEVTTPFYFGTAQNYGKRYIQVSQWYIGSGDDQSYDGVIKTNLSINVVNGHNIQANAYNGSGGNITSSGGKIITTNNATAYTFANSSIKNKDNGYSATGTTLWKLIQDCLGAADAAKSAADTAKSAADAAQSRADSAYSLASSKADASDLNNYVTNETYNSHKHTMHYNMGAVMGPDGKNAIQAVLGLSGNLDVNTTTPV